MASVREGEDKAQVGKRPDKAETAVYQRDKKS